MQNECDVLKAWERKYPEQVVLVITKNKAGRINAMAVGWISIVSDEPAMFQVGIDDNAYTLELIRETKEFTIAFTYNLGAVPNSTGDEVFEVKEYVEPVQPPVTPVEKKKCGKKSSEIIIAALCAISVVALVQKKKH